LTDPIESKAPIDYAVDESEPASGGAGSEARPARLERTTSGAVPSTLIIAAVASIAAGAIHATAAGPHAEQRPAQMAFVLCAVFQLGWGALALARSRPWISLLGAAGNAAALGGWVLAKTTGIGFISGLENSEGPEFADSLAAGLAAVAVLGALASLATRFGSARRPQPVLVGVALLATLGLGVPGMVEAGSHGHADGHDGGHDMGHDAAAVIPPKPYDGTLPVDFSGVPGVTTEQQHEAEALATRTIERLPQWADTQTAYDAGFRSIGDAPTGVEHYINWRWIGDDRVLDPDHPESLVYRVDGQRRTLVAAMYMGRLDDTLETFPGVGGKLIQSHIHNNLCFAGETYAWRVAGIADPPRECPPGTQRLGNNNVPMIHVWLTGHPCGPFAALEGIGGGQIAEGETVNCDHQHADPSANPEGEGLFGGGGGRGPRGGGGGGDGPAPRDS
jgi:hypothetical protein